MRYNPYLLLTDVAHTYDVREKHMFVTLGDDIGRERLSVHKVRDQEIQTLQV